MAERGRRTAENKRINQYRVLMNDKEDLMLDYCRRRNRLCVPYSGGTLPFKGQAVRCMA